MSFRKEPPFTHGTVARSAVVLVNLGTPEEPTRGAVRRYLKEFLSDPRVVEIPRLVWWFILNLIILPFRSGKSAKKYESIWTREGSPLKVHTQVLDKLKAEHCERVVILPAYPQYSGTTTASIYDAVFAHYAKVRDLPELRMVKHYHDHDSYIEALHDSVLAFWETNGRGQKLLMSFHGVPKRTLMLGDPYHCECHKTARLLAAKLRLKPDQYVVTFQSRFGKAEWLQPYTAPTLQQLARDGVESIDVICPGFTSDCLETLEEIAMEAKHDFLAAGGKQFHYIACLNEDPSWIAGLAEIAEQHLIGWPTMMTAVQREAEKKDAETGRERALAMGAG